MGLVLALLAAIPKIGGLIQFSEQLNQQGGNALYFRGLLNDLAMHFITNWVLWTLVVAVIAWLWRKNTALLIALLVILAGVIALLRNIDSGSFSPPAPIPPTTSSLSETPVYPPTPYNPAATPTLTPMPYYGEQTLQECRDAWVFFMGEEGTDEERAKQARETVEYLYAYIFRNPESFGYIVKACIDGGWEEWEMIPAPPPFP